MKIDNSEILSIKDRWANICNEYLEKFCRKHKYNIDPYPWVGDDPGTVAMIGDLLVGMDNMRYDIDNNIPEDFFEKWYWLESNFEVLFLFDLECSVTSKIFVNM